MTAHLRLNDLTECTMLGGAGLRSVTNSSCHVPTISAVRVSPLSLLSVARPHTRRRLPGRGLELLGRRRLGAPTVNPPQSAVPLCGAQRPPQRIVPLRSPLTLDACASSQVTSDTDGRLETRRYIEDDRLIIVSSGPNIPLLKRNTQQPASDPCPPCSCTAISHNRWTPSTGRKPTSRP